MSCEFPGDVRRTGKHLLTLMWWYISHTVQYAFSQNNRSDSQTTKESLRSAAILLMSTPGSSWNACLTYKRLATVGNLLGLSCLPSYACPSFWHWQSPSCKWRKNRRRRMELRGLTSFAHQASESVKCHSKASSNSSNCRTYRQMLPIIHLLAKLTSAIAGRV